MAIIGIDVGTSGCKVCAFDQTGTILSSSREKYPEIRGKGIREIDPVVVKEKIQSALTDAAKNCPEKIMAISVTCLGESLVITDENEKILCNSMVTGDERGEDGVEIILKELGAEYSFSTAGLMPSPLYTLPKLIHLSKTTDILKKAKHIYFYEDYVGYLLTGERKVSCSSAARSMALDIRNLKWDEKSLSLAGLTPEHFSKPVASGSIIGYVHSEAAKAYHLPEGIPVVAGAHDQVCAALGSGFMDYSLGEDGIGTCECLALMLPDTYDSSILERFDMPNMIYPLPGKYFTTLEVTTCGALMNWARDTLFKSTYEACEAQGIDFFSYMDSKVTGLTTDVMILPQFGSSGHPDLNLSSDMVGTITGLRLETAPEELYLALKESLLFQIKLAYESCSDLGLTFDKMVMTGGAANSKVSAQLRADIFQKPVYSLKNSEAGALGCMILASVAVNLYPDIETAIRNVVAYTGETLPIPQNKEYYEAKYLKFKQLYQKMHILTA